MVLNYIRQKVGDVLGSAEPVSQNQLQSERYTRYLNRNPSQDPTAIQAASTANSQAYPEMTPASSQRTVIGNTTGAESAQQHRRTESRNPKEASDPAGPNTQRLGMSSTHKPAQNKAEVSKASIVSQDAASTSTTLMDLDVKAEAAKESSCAGIDRATYISKIDALENHEKQLKARLQDKEGCIRQFRKYTQELEAQIREGKQEYSELIARSKSKIAHGDQMLAETQKKMASLSKDLEDCKERIFSMQPVQGMTDAQLVELFNNLCRNIEDWVETSFGDVEDAIMTMAKTPDVEGGQHWVHVVLNQRELWTVNHDPSTDKVMLASFIFRMLYKHFLRGQRLIPGLPESCHTLLSHLIKAVGNLQPTNGSERSQMWRVDLHRALGASEQVKGWEGVGLNETQRILLSALKPIMQTDQISTSDESSAREIIESASDLATNLNLAVDEYNFDAVYDARKMPEVMRIAGEALTRFHVIDSRTGLPLRSFAKIAPASDGKVGELVFLVFPGLGRIGTETKAAVRLCKPTIVVRFDNEVLGAGKRKGTGNYE